MQNLSYIIFDVKDWSQKEGIELTEDQVLSIANAIKAHDSNHLFI